MTKIWKQFWLTILIVMTICIIESKGQDTINYVSYLTHRIIYESLTLYPNNTFKWTSEYDLSWDEYGEYTKDEKQLVLNYYIQFNYPKTMSLKDSIKLLRNPVKIEKYKFENGKVYRLDNSGRKMKRIKEKSIGTWYGWIIGYKYRYEWVMTAEE